MLVNVQVRSSNVFADKQKSIAKKGAAKRNTAASRLLGKTIGCCACVCCIDITVLQVNIFL